MKLILFALGAAALLALALISVEAWKTSRLLTSPWGYSQPDPASFTFAETPETQAGLPYEDVMFAAPDGGQLRGWLVPGEDAEKDLAVITLHGRGGDRRGYLPMLGALRQTGAAVLLFDFRENGLSDGAGRGTGLAVREAEDAIAAAQEMKRRGYRKVVAFGCSLGGSAGLIAAAREPAIDGVIAEGAIASFEDFVADELSQRLAGRGISASWAADIWGQAVVALTRLRTGLEGYESAEDAAAKIGPRPVLLVHGQEDGVVLERHARQLEAAAQPSEGLWMIEGAGHCEGFAVVGGEYSRRIADFLETVSRETAASQETGR